ncbi:MAG: hypothetical protein HYX71_06765 [Opitutae bacterium]|nr:hypothetical protein [Opitutae bacterium]
MKSAPSESSDLVLRLRQQLILAQVRIMELEDARDTLAPRLAELEGLLSGAQSLADRKLEETAHLEKILAEARQQSAQLRQLQQQSDAALAEARAALAEATGKLTRSHDTITRLESELRGLTSSRSWRWTAWLRRLGGQP